MKKHLGVLHLLGLAIVTLLSSCSKEAALEKEYYGKLKVEVTLLPGTPALSMRVNGDSLISLPMTSPAFFKANKSGKIEVYETSTGVVLGDTTVMITKNELTTLKFAYSKDYGFKGWINTAPISPDSIQLQIQNKLSVANYPQPYFDLQVCTFDPGTSEISVPVAVLDHFNSGLFYPKKLTLPVLDASGNFIWYVGRLKDPVTGEFIINPALGTDLFVLVILGDAIQGTSGLYIVSDDASGGIETQQVLL